MKEYELTIETRQPPCGGKAPKRVEIREIETDNPFEYVSAIEKDIELTQHTNDDGDLVILAEKDQYRAHYTFTEI